MATRPALQQGDLAAVGAWVRTSRGGRLEERGLARAERGGGSSVSPRCPCVARGRHGSRRRGGRARQGAPCRRGRERRGGQRPRSWPAARRTIETGSGALRGDDFLDRRWVGGVADPLVARRPAGVQVAGERRRPAASSNGSDMIPPRASDNASRPRFSRAVRPPRAPRSQGDTSLARDADPRWQQSTSAASVRRSDVASAHSHGGCRANRPRRVVVVDFPNASGERADEHGRSVSGAAHGGRPRPGHGSVLRGFLPTVLPYGRPATSGQDGAALEISPTREVCATASHGSRNGTASDRAPPGAWSSSKASVAARRHARAASRIQASSAWCTPASPRR
jgi:hypothetical protein